MDHTTFDRLARLISASRSRRAALRILAGAILPALIGGDAEAKRKSRRRAHAKRHHADKRRGHGKTRTEATATRKTRSARGGGGCCASGNCTPGPGKKLAKCCYEDGQLAGQNFKGANLASASFARADLTDANFNGANVSKVCFVDADLTGATFGGANTSGAILCRTLTSNGVDDSGCDRGTPCCPTCDADHPCAADEVCCDGRCFAGDCCGNSEQSTCAVGELCCDHRCTDGVCCQAGDCPAETCQRRACRDNQCAYTPISGQDGPGCQTVCCQDATGAPDCCTEGATTCDGRGLCCAADSPDETCGVGTATPRCGEVTNNCNQQVDCGPCAERICQDGTCTGANNTCEYRPVFGDPGPRCQTLCCRDTAGNPECCTAGVTECFPSGGCRCRDNQDCAANDVCCDGRCEAPIWANEAVFGSGPGDAPDQFNRIIGVAVSADERTAWMVDQPNHRVSVWARNASGQWENETRFGALGSGLGQFDLPFGVAVSDDGLTAFVGDQGSQQTLEGSRVSVWRKQLNGSWTNPFSLGSGTGDGADQFENPTGVAVSGNGRTLWVADTGNKRVSVWEESGGFWTPSATFGSSGTGPGQFSDPVGVAVSGTGQTAWVIDRINTRVSVWTRQANGNWTFDTDFGGFGDHEDEWRGPLGVAATADGQTAFVADLGHNRISIWTRQANGDWAHAENFGGGPGSDRSQFDGPFGLALSADGRTVWVSDQNNHRVSIWSLSGCPVT